MDNDKIAAYMKQVDNEYDAVRQSAADEFGRMWEKGNPTKAHVEGYAEWRKHWASWKAWYWEVKDDWWLSVDDYNTARDWHLQLANWKKRLGEFTRSVPSTPVAERENTAAEDIQQAAGAATAPIALAASAALIGFLLWRNK